MSISEILNNKDADAGEQLIAVAKVVAGAREAYGNTGEDIGVPDVDTAHGAMAFDMLDADSKVHVLKSEVVAVKAAAVEYCRNNPGTVINKKIEELLATNGLFANIAPGTKFDYI